MMWGRLHKENMGTFEVTFTKAASKVIQVIFNQSVFYYVSAQQENLSLVYFNDKLH